MTFACSLVAKCMLMIMTVVCVRGLTHLWRPRTASCTVMSFWQWQLCLAQLMPVQESLHPPHTYVSMAAAGGINRRKTSSVCWMEYGAVGWLLKPSHCKQLCL